MYTRPTRLIKLAIKQSGENFMDKNKSVHLNILTTAGEDEETGKYLLLFYF